MEKWKKANRVNFAFLEYDNVDSSSGNALPAPQRQGPTPIEAALLKQMQVIEHDVQTSLGMFKAAVGESESQQSGRAILALQRESDTSTYHFGANLGVSIRHAGRIIVDMIPHYYDTKRIVRILGEDGQPQPVMIDPSQDVSHREIQTSRRYQAHLQPRRRQVRRFDHDGAELQHEAHGGGGDVRRARQGRDRSGLGGDPALPHGEELRLRGRGRGGADDAGAPAGAGIGSAGQRPAGAAEGAGADAADEPAVAGHERGRAQTRRREREAAERRGAAAAEDCGGS
jgi:hypothetical protein